MAISSGEGERRANESLERMGGRETKIGKEEEGARTREGRA